jgi:hypothetical protein
MYDFSVSNWEAFQKMVAAGWFHDAFATQPNIVVSRSKDFPCDVYMSTCGTKAELVHCGVDLDVNSDLPEDVTKVEAARAELVEWGYAPTIIEEMVATLEGFGLSVW